MGRVQLQGQINGLELLSPAHLNQQAIQRFVYNMKSGDLQMNLRRKRNTGSYQGNDQHFNSYKEYEEVTRGGYRKENPSRTSEHGNLAKILVDFISKINSSTLPHKPDCREKEGNSRDPGKRHAQNEYVSEPRKKQKTEQNSTTYADQFKKHELQTRPVERKEQKKQGNRDLYRFKDQVTPNLKNLISDSKLGPAPSQKAPPPQASNQVPNLSYMNLISQFGNQQFAMNNFASLVQMQSILNGASVIPNFNFNNVPQTNFGDRIPPYQLPSADAMLKMGMIGNFGEGGSAQMIKPFQAPKNPDKPSNSKLFKRAAYHVAIAYHIHLKKVQQKEKGNPGVPIDPTYYAKQLRLKKYEPKQMQSQVNQPQQSPEKPRSFNESIMEPFSMPKFESESAPGVALQQIDIQLVPEMETDTAPKQAPIPQQQK